MGTMKEDRQSQFFNWLAKSVSSAQLSELYQAFTDLEYIISSNRYLYNFPNDSLIETTDANTVEKLYFKLAASKQFMRSSKSAVKLNLLNYYARYCKEVLSPGNVSSSEISNPEVIDPAIVKSNQQAFAKWLDDDDLDTIEVFSIYMAAREIHKMILKAGSVPGLFGIVDRAYLNACAKSAIQSDEFIKNDRLTGRLWTKAMDSYLRFAGSQDFKAISAMAANSHSDSTTKVTSVVAESPKRTYPMGQKPANDVMNEDDFRNWLIQNKPNEQVDLMISTIRNVEQYAQKNNMRSIKFFGIKPSETIACVNHMLVSRSFVLYSAGLYQNFKHAAMLLNEYKKVLASTTLGVADSMSKTEKEATATTDQLPKEENDPKLEPSLMMLLQGEQLAVLRDALVSKGILTLERFKQLNLWVFMNQNGLYSIGQRQKVYSIVRRAMTSENSKKADTDWKLTTILHKEYHAASPAEALVEYCRSIAAKYPLKIRGLVGQRIGNTDTIPLLRTRMHARDIRLDNPEAYVDSEMSDEIALLYARWISSMCRDNDLPDTLTCIDRDNESDQAEKNEGESAKKEIKNSSDSDGRIVSLTDGDGSFCKNQISITYKGKVSLADSWKNAYRAVCQILYQDQERKMLRLVYTLSSTGIASHYASERTKRQMKSPLEFAPCCYFEAALTDTEIMKRMRELLTYFNVTDDLEIRYESATNMPSKHEREKQDEQLNMEDKHENVSTLQKKVEDVVLKADLNGITLEQLQDQIPGVTMVALKRIRDSSPKLVDIADKIIHVDAFVDWDEGAQKLEEILEKLLNKNNGYVSYSQLYEYARAEMKMFLNDNDMDDPRKVFDMAEHLFTKEGYHGKRYTFSMKTHISLRQEIITSNLDVIKKFASDHNGFFRFDDLEEYLEQVGIKTGNLRGQMQIGYKPIFFYYSSEEIISAESMQIDNAWLEKAGKALERLFADVGDHIVLRSINPVWYEQMPMLPGYHSWTPLLLQFILQFYGKRLGAKTIRSELNQNYDVLHAMLVMKNSEIQTFADAVVAYLVDNGIPERQFEAEKLRGRLIDGGLIAGNELMNIQKAIGSDSRFAWDASGGKVNIKV